ncbi:hypothetical protein CBR_g3716 [Chara braunii]|uniref:Myb-like domain-containing protein n=1 Tax=Chara braunii TaxID=69332 RepID=A0A388KG67_CHABU|nr:hypothetical protein CBR_g3716 [Chara braunii]|eukprot:GBG69016.1 hypothetical protein CBR_g3716 [Chara braunii]
MGRGGYGKASRTDGHQPGVGFEYGMDRGGYGESPRSDGYPIDPAAYAHLPSYMQPLPGDTNWEPPPSTLPLAWGSTQTSYDSGDRVGERSGSRGPMSALLAGEGDETAPPLGLRLSKSCGMEGSRTVLVDHGTHSHGQISVTMRDAGEDSACRSVQGRRYSTATSVCAPPTASAGGRGGGSSPAPPSPPVVERIVATFKRLPTGTGREGGGHGGDCIGDNEGGSDEDEKTDVREVTPRPSKKKPSKSRASKGKEKAVGGNRTCANWDLNDSLLLVRCKRDQEDYLANVGHNFARMKTKEWKWMDIAKRMTQQGVRNRDWDSENAEGDGGDGARSRSSGSLPTGKQKNARQLAFDAVTDGMKTPSTVVAESVDRASKRQCEVLQRQCDIMDREASTQERQCAVLDPGQRMLCDALLKIASALSLPMDIVVALRGRVLRRCSIFYEMRHRHGNAYGREFDFMASVTHHEIRHYEVDTDGDTYLHLTVGFVFTRGLLRQVVGFAMKVGTAIPDRWDRGVDVLAEIVDLLVWNVAMEYGERLNEPAVYRVHVDPPLEGREHLHDELGEIGEEFY